MKAIIQRVSCAMVTSKNGSVQIGKGFVILLGVRHEDSMDDVALLARKTAALRIFEDEQGRMNHSLADLEGNALVVSQFTLYADTRKGNRPSFIRAAHPEKAEPLYEAYVNALRQTLGNDHVETGWFGADMDLEIHNDGPVTIELCSD
jgi:D-tyrosyl-tRNA(Tyr) deacylase